MKRATGIIILGIIMCCICIPRGFPKLRDFKEDVEKEERENREKSSSRDSIKIDHDADREWGTDTNSDETADFGSCIVDSCIAYVLLMQFEGNYYMFYTRYPYSDDGEIHFIGRTRDIFSNDYDKKTPANENGSVKSYGNKKDNNKTQKDPTKSQLIIDDRIKHITQRHHCYLKPEIAGQWAGDDGYSFSVRVSTKLFHFFGPEFEYKRVMDGDDYLDYYAAGMNISTIQSDLLTLDLYVQAINMRGILKRSGVGFGLFIYSYPVKPVSLMFRLGRQEYQYIGFYDLEGRIGFLIDRFELFGGYRHLMAKYADLGGPVVGVRLHF